MTSPDWNNPVPELLGEREDSPRSMRWPKDLAADVEAMAKEQGQEFSTVALYLLKNAVAEVRASRAGKKRTSQQAMKRAV